MRKEEKGDLTRLLNRTRLHIEEKPRSGTRGNRALGKTTKRRITYKGLLPVGGERETIETRELGKGGKGRIDGRAVQKGRKMRVWGGRLVRL